MNDDMIIQLYWNRVPDAIAQTQSKYGHPLMRISKNLLSSNEDAEECVNDTYLQSWNSMPPQKPTYLFAYLGRIVRNLALNRWNHNHAQKRNTQLEVMLGELTDCLPALNSTEDIVDEGILADCITHWLSSLSLDDRLIFMRRYWYGESVQKLALKNCRTPKQLASHLYRLRQNLRSVLEKEGYEL